MIKGVSKQILEVTNTENPYFEKIVFYVKPEHQSLDRKKLQKEAETVAATAQKPPRLKISKRQLLKTAAGCAVFTAVGCIITLIINFFV